MQAGTSPFLSLPRELRDHIYSFCVNYPDIHQVITRQDARTLQSLYRHGFRPNEADIDALVEFAGPGISGRPQMHCPTVFLVNRQTSHEATEMLHTKPLVIDAPITTRHIEGLRFPDFVSEVAMSLVQNATLVIKLDGSRRTMNWWSVPSQLDVYPKLNLFPE